MLEAGNAFSQMLRLDKFLVGSCGNTGIAAITLTHS